MRKQFRTLLGILCLLLAASLLISGCTPAKGAEPQQEQQTQETKDSVQEIPLSLEEGWIAGDIAANENTVFYLLAQEVPMAQQALRAVKLCAYDLASEKETVVYEETNEEGFFLNELEAVADGIFWVRTEGGQQTIEKLDLATKEVQVIEQYGQEAGDILLQSDGKYLTWYCTAGETASIQGYQAAENALVPVAEKVVPLARANVVDGICAYVVEEGDQTVIQVFDLAAQKVLQKIPLEKGTALFQVIADRDRCLYSLAQQGVMGQQVFVFDYADGETTVVNEDESLHLFSWSYAGGTLYLNEQTAIQVRQATGAPQTIKGEKETLYVLGSTTPDGNYLTLNAADEAAPILTLIRA